MKTVRFLHCENAYDSYQEPPHLLSWKRVMWEKRAKNPIRTYYVAFATLLWLRATNAARHDLADYRMHIPFECRACGPWHIEQGDASAGPAGRSWSDSGSLATLAEMRGRCRAFTCVMPL
jgi:hypothetical protein